MYKAIEVASYVINYINEQNGHTSNLKLQKLLYYIQAAFLCERDRRCFDDPILCWRHGPVIQSVYNKFSQYGGDEIPWQKSESRFIFKDGRLQFINIDIDKERISEEDKRLIDSVLNGMMNYSAWYLVDRTHEETPWKNLKYYNEEIKTEDIQDFFNKHRERLYGKFN